MSKKIDTIAAGLNGLLSAPAQLQGTTANTAPTPQETEQAPKQKGNYKTVCYSIPPELAEQMRYIAYWDRKRLNAVVVEAFQQYAANWKPTTGEIPGRFTKSERREK